MMNDCTVSAGGTPLNITMHLHTDAHEQTEQRTQATGRALIEAAKGMFAVLRRALLLVGELSFFAELTTETAA